MVKRVALAIRQALEAEPGYIDCMAAARAAIEAMGEPTGEMLAAAREKMTMEDDTLPPDELSTRYWFAMIGAAVNTSSCGVIDDPA
ncbi:hypothetical protein EN828_10355 [Mesorhizobium sp. M2D.F.Ca.ET.185.01.1.1]|uniref:hypothetical protein n=1 Tax=unclassified Mesorhizobium TaxID=325217 RepID=UPI000FCA21B8|nr:MULTISPECIES: hypothetical protein [unclassified Mesorhizobium]TGT96030.1 hypothetical protein EN806_53195 [bacterium M00.F.Ca.ET.163.01.1.1]TGV79190.1 hypothetical protein EN792_042960 [Mesorhizobium sp. M00.F.Ca.ET.149.01.1.1]TGP25919.1 hypothetical protein EN875_034345 [Mesorhizobium sp. M2D.F.Ca.ET.232.01.1.1]TGQ23890.1 hypothetical protein EN863_064595 [Mesorhizobium sp. M00.F.Ca.ET.220.01.1.1]TGQ89438.1 hypothetical protein EN849_09855 [Mesorhizobium sp. M2D.F.Ca.ET.206.01.1.1]